MIRILILISGMIWIAYGVLDERASPKLRQGITNPQHSTESNAPLRSKRFAISTALTVIVNGIKIGQFAYGLIKDRQKAAKDKAIRQQLKDISVQLTELSIKLGSIAGADQWQEAAIVYAHDVNRLDFILHKLADFEIGPDGSLQPEADVRAWAHSVLSLDQDGIPDVLFSMHKMMMGTSQLFSRKPLFTVFVNRHNVTQDDFYARVRDFVSYMYGVQFAGYIAWATALNTYNQHEEVEAVLSSGMTRLDEQRVLLDSLLEQLWTEAVDPAPEDDSYSTLELNLIFSLVGVCLGFAIVIGCMCWCMERKDDYIIKDQCRNHCCCCFC